MVLRPIVPALWMFLTFTPAEAQEPPQGKPGSSPLDSFDTLAKRVKPGATVYVSDVASGEVEGRLLRISATSVTVLVQGTEREFQKTDLRQLARRGDSLKNGALIGMGAMALWGAIVSNRTEDIHTSGIDTHGPSMAAVLPIVLGMGAGLGALIDRAHKGRTIVYRSAPSRISAHPIVHPRQLGVRVALRF